MDINTNADNHAKIVQEAIETVIDCNNRCSDELVAEGILKALQGSHRTLQASFIRSLSLVLKQYGTTEHYDARNEGAIEWAKEVSKVERHIPFI